MFVSLFYSPKIRFFLIIHGENTYHSNKGLPGKCFTDSPSFKYNSLIRCTELFFSASQRLIKVYYTLYFLKTVGRLL